MRGIYFPFCARNATGRSATGDTVDRLAFVTGRVESRSFQPETLYSRKGTRPFPVLNVARTGTQGIFQPASTFYEMGWHDSSRWPQETSLLDGEGRSGKYFMGGEGETIFRREAFIFYGKGWSFMVEKKVLK